MKYPVPIRPINAQSKPLDFFTPYQTKEGKDYRSDIESFADVVIKKITSTDDFASLSQKQAHLVLVEANGIYKWVASEPGSGEYYAAADAGAYWVKIFGPDSSSSSSGPRRLKTFTSTETTTSTSVDYLMTYTIPANTFINDGDTVIGEYTLNSPAVLSGGVNFGATIDVVGSSRGISGGATENWFVKIIAAKTGTTNIKVTLLIWLDTFGMTINFSESSSFDFTVDNDIKVYSYCSSGGTMTAYFGTVDFIPAET